jgi:cation:H+ antiporter
MPSVFPTGQTVLLLTGGIVALAALVWAAGIVVDRSLGLARHYGVSEVLIGVFVLSIGTSLPELGTHVIASAGILSGTLDYTVASSTVIGGSIGSSTVQQLLLVGLLLVGFGRYVVDESLLRWSYLPMLGSFVLLFVLGIDGTVSRLDGIVMLVVFLAYAHFSFSRTRRRAVLQAVPPESKRIWQDALIAVGALAVVLGSAYVVLAVVDATIDSLGLGGSMVGVITIGIAAALPELSTVMESLRRRTPTLALGTLLGSNVVNTLVGVGIGGALSTYGVPVPVLWWDIPFKFVVGVGLLGYLLIIGDGTLGRREGIALVLAYGVYIVGRLLVFG